MERSEAVAKQRAAFEILRRRGWTQAQIEKLVDGLYREDAVEVAERAVAHEWTPDS